MSRPEVDVVKVEGGHGHVGLVLLHVCVGEGRRQLDGAVGHRRLLVQEGPRYDERPRAPGEGSPHYRGPGGREGVVAWLWWRGGD